MSILEQSTSLYGQQFKKTITDNFQYEGISVNLRGYGDSRFGADFLGYNTDSDGTNWKSFIQLNIFIPSNFTVTNATITFIHTPVNWSSTEVGFEYNFWGYCRNIKAYKVTNQNNLLVEAGYGSEYNINTMTTLEIYGAFDDSGYTPSVPNDSSYITETKISNDIKAQLTTGNNIILVQTGDEVPVYNADYVTNITNCGVKTGYARAIANIFGYYS